VTGVQPCPECAAGKHRICIGQSWDETTDDFAPCPCQQAGHDLAAHLQHRVTCPGPDVSITRGVSKVLLHCRPCGVEAWVTS